MALQFILGHTGAGKTRYLYQQLRESKQSNRILIVPEQSTLITQKSFLEQTVGHSIMDVEVLSFQRLAYRLADYLGMAGRTLLDDNAQHMLIRRLIDEDIDKYPFLSKNAHRKGYISELKQLLAEFMRYQVNEEKLTFTITQLKVNFKGELLPVKLEELKHLQKAYEKALSDNYVTQESVLTLLQSKMGQLEFFKDAEIYIDGFYGFTPIQYGIIRRLLIQAERVVVAITIDRKAFYQNTISESHLFYEAKETIKMIRQLADEEGIEKWQDFCLFDEVTTRFKQPVLYHLRNHLYQFPLISYHEKVSGLTLCQASTVKKEIDYCIDTIWFLVQEKGYRFSDISILCGQIESYERILIESFKDAKIPLYIDVKTSLLKQPFVQWIIGILELSCYGYNQERVCTLLKNGLFAYDQGIIDDIENYSLAYGIRSKKSWITDFSRPIPLLRLPIDHNWHQERLKKLNVAKQAYMRSIDLGVSIQKKKRSIRERIIDLVTYFETLGIENILLNQADSFYETGQLLREKEYRQIYKKVMELFDQMTTLLGDAIVDAFEFKELFEAGIEQLKIGTLPAAIDQVVIGDVSRSRLIASKALFVIGANEGVLPKMSEKASLMTDNERLLLEQLGLPLAPTAKIQLFKEQFNIMMAMTQVTKRLYISYAKSTPTGESARPAYVVQQIKKMFPSCKVIDVDHRYKNKLIINQPKLTFNKLIEGFRNNHNLKDFDQTLIWFKESDEFKDLFAKTLEGMLHDINEKNLGIKETQRLYGEEIAESVTRLENYANCPFKHFLDYGLHIKERKQYEIGPPELGIIFHRIIEEFTKKILDEGIDWSEVTEALRTKWIDDCVEHLMQEDAQLVFYFTQRNRYLIDKVKRMANRTLWVISCQLMKSGFRPEKTEWHYKKGIIDRVDSIKLDGATYVAVIDYKSGHHEIDLVDLYHGLQLQLFVYLDAVIEHKMGEGHEEIRPAGAFYFHIDDPMITVNQLEDQETLDREILSKMRLSGMVLNDIRIMKEFDRELVGKSLVIPVTLKKDGLADAKSHVLELEDFMAILRYVKQKSLEMKLAIVDGDIRVYPYRKGRETACERCTYKSVCLFDDTIESCHYNHIALQDKGEVVDSIKNHGDR